MLLLNFLLILFQLYIMHPSPTHLSIFSYLPFPLKNPQNTHANTHTHTHKWKWTTAAVTTTTTKAVVCQCIHVPSYLYFRMLSAMSHWSRSRSLASVTPSVLEPQWDSSKSSYCCPVSWGSCSCRSAGIFTHLNHLQSPGYGPGWPSLVGQPVYLALPYPHGQRKLFSTAPARPPNAVIIRKQNQLSCSHALGLSHHHCHLQKQHHCASQSRCRAPLSYML